MRNAHTVAQVRDAEAPLLTSLPPGALMQRAVYGLVAHVVRRLGRVVGTRIVVLAGSGDNGGDALWAGARLAARGARVDALAPGRTHPAATAALLAAGGRLHRLDPTAGQPLADEAQRVLLDAADLVLDGLLGIGGRGGLRDIHARLAAVAPAARTVAVDVPSGVDADTGAVSGPAVQASATVTFGTYKRGLWLLPGAAHTGPVELVDIGLALPAGDLRALDDADVAALLPVPDETSSKYRRGVLGLVAGSDEYPGAAVLAVGGALRGGAGYLRVITQGHVDPTTGRPRSRAGDLVHQTHPEAVVTAIAAGDVAGLLGAGRVQAWAVGPGLPPGAPVRALLAAVLDTEQPAVVDAGGLDPLAELLGAAPQALHERAAPVLVTPHEGEFGRFVQAALGWEPQRTAADLAADRLGTVRRAAAGTGAVILLKGARTLVVEPSGAAWVNTTGTAWLGSAGTGDVLTGLVGSLLAAGLPAAPAGAAGAYLHGRAGERAVLPLAAADLPDLVAGVVTDLLAAPPAQAAG